MTKISRDNDGYVPIDELQRRIELDVEAVNRSQAFTQFTTQNAHVFFHDKQGKSDRQANAVSGQTKRAPLLPSSGGGSGTPLTGGVL